MTRNELILKLVNGAIGFASKKERDPEVVKEWVNDAILKCLVEYDRYKHLPESQLILVLGQVCKNTIYNLQRKEIEKDKRSIRYDLENDRIPDGGGKILDDGHYEPFQHRISDRPNLAYVPPHEYDSPLECILSKELLVVLLQKLDHDGRRFVKEKLFPSAETIKEMELDKAEHPLDKHIFPNKSKAMVSRIKSHVKDWLDRLGVLSIQELSNQGHPSRGGIVQEQEQEANEPVEQNNSNQVSDCEESPEISTPHQSQETPQLLLLSPSQG